MENRESLIQKKEEHKQKIENFFEENPYWSQDIWDVRKSPLLINEWTQQHVTLNFSKSINENITRELKHYLATRLVNETYSPTTIFCAYRKSITRIIEFFNEYYSQAESIIVIPKEKFQIAFRTFLISKGNPVSRTKSYLTKGQIEKKRTEPSTYLQFSNQFYEFYLSFYDTRDEVEKDIWNVKHLGIEYNKTSHQFTMNFMQIHEIYRKLIKEYLRVRVVQQQSMTFSTGNNYLLYLSNFFNFIAKKYPKRSNLREVARNDILEYLEFLRNNPTKRRSKPSDHYIHKSLYHLNKFIDDIQRYEWDEAPTKNVRLLIFPEDYPKVFSISDKIKYIPDHVWEQVLENLDEVNPSYVPILLLMEASGFRVSDVLGLKIDCLHKDNDEKWWLIGDQRKVKHKEHKVPISDEIANVVMAQRELTKIQSTKENNPDGFLFVRFKGIRKGSPIGVATISNCLQTLAQKVQIQGDDEKIFHFNNHAFRHRYGVNLVNNGMNILHVQRLMAHASPEMTLVYARLHDRTLRDEWNKAKERGAVRLDAGGSVIEADFEEQVLENGLELEWIRHNLDSIRMEHGFCIKSPKISCDFLEQALEPPCIKNKCKSFHVDRTFADFYESQIEKLLSDIDIYKRTGRERSLQFAEQKLSRYRDILSGIYEKGGIFGLPKGRREYSEERN